MRQRQTACLLTAGYGRIITRQRPFRSLNTTMQKTALLDLLAMCLWQLVD